MDHGKYAISESAYYVCPRSGWAPRLAEVPPPRRVMMRAIIMVVATAAVLIDPTSVAFTQDAQTTAEIASNGTEIPLADCGAGGVASRDWAVVPDTTASSGTAIEHARSVPAEAAGALAICRSARLGNGDLSLRFKVLSGESNEGGGLALRMATPEDYYLVKADAHRDRALLLLVKNGTAEEIVGVDADVAVDAWHTLSVRAQDESFTIYLDGTWIFTGYDKTLPHAGRIALWSEPGGTTRFDRIIMAPIPKPQSWRR